jgi:Two component regulator propeller
MHATTLLSLAFFSTLSLLAFPLPSCQLYGQQEKIDSPLLTQKVIQPKLIKTQGSDEHDNIHAMLQDKNGDVWFATTGEGVYWYNCKGFVQYTQQDGLSSYSRGQSGRSFFLTTFAVWSV